MTALFDALAEQIAALARKLDCGAARFDYDLNDGTRVSFGFDRDRLAELVVAAYGLVWRWHEKWEVS